MLSWRDGFAIERSCGFVQETVLAGDSDVIRSGKVFAAMANARDACGRIHRLGEGVLDQILTNGGSTVDRRN